MYEFLSQDGFLIQTVFPGLAVAHIIFAHRLAKLLQFISALVIVIEFLGVERVNQMIDMACQPFVKALEGLKMLFRQPRRDEGSKPEPDFPFWAFPIYTVVILAVWWSSAPLPSYRSPCGYR